MWLTGFDAPCMNTMYIDKPMRGHGLMQAIARVNRVFRDKPGGLIVDYIGIGTNLRKALADYSNSDREQTGIDEEVAIAKMLECFERVKAIFHGFDYATGFAGAPQQRVATLAGAIDWVLKWQEGEAAKEGNDEDKKRAHRAYQDRPRTDKGLFACIGERHRRKGSRRGGIFPDGAGRDRKNDAFRRHWQNRTGFCRAATHRPRNRLVRSGRYFEGRRHYLARYLDPVG
jgi:hypothetical protein